MKFTYSIEDLSEIADKILENCHSKILLFYGEMGVGKTTLIKELSKKLGVVESISSPTFSIVNEYQAQGGKIYHFDFYRLENEVEALDIGLEDYLYSGHWVFAEWPEKIVSFLPENCTGIQLDKNQNGTRSLNIMPMKH